MKYFEFVCTRNEGRSPVAEFIAQWYLEKKGLSKEYGAKSSGSHRLHISPNEIQSSSEGDVPFEFMEKLIRLAIEQNAFQNATEIEKDLSEKNTEILKPYFREANRFFKMQERHFRSDAIARLVEEKNLSGYLKAHSDQTEAHPDVIAIFGMSETNTKKIQEIYSTSEFKPIIATLGVYATGDESAELPNAFAKGSVFYQDVIDQLFEIIPEAIDKYIKVKPE